MQQQKKKLATFSEDLFRTTGKDPGTGINEKFSGIDLSFNAAERQVKTLLVEVPLAFFLESERESVSHDMTECLQVRDQTLPLISRNHSFLLCCGFYCSSFCYLQGDAEMAWRAENEVTEQFWVQGRELQHCCGVRRSYFH